MIITFFLNLLYSFVSGVVALLPTGSLPTQVSTALTSIWGFVNAFSYVIAVDTLIQVVLLAIAFDLVLLVWHLAQWVIRKIPGMQ